MAHGRTADAVRVAQQNPRTFRALLIVGYAAFVGLALASVLVLGIQALAMPLVVAVVVYFGATSMRAAAFLLLFLPFLVSYLEFNPPWRVYPGYLAVVILAVAWVRERRAAPERVRVPRRDLALFAGFAAMVWLSWAFGDWRTSVPVAQIRALGVTTRFCLASVVALLVVPALSDRGRVRTFMWVVLATALVPTYSLFFIDTGQVDDPNLLIERASGLFAHGPHTAGVYELFYLLTSLGLVVTEHDRVRRLWLSIATGVFFVALILTGSRTVLISLVVIGVAALFTIGRAVWRRIGLVHVYFLIVAVVVTMLAAAPIVKITPGTGVYQILTTGRMALVRFGLGLAASHPFLGVGFGIHDFYLAEQPAIAQFGLNIHTYYVSILVETGVPGFLLFLTLIGSVVVHFIRAAAEFRAQGDTEMEVAANAFLLSFVGILFMFLTQAGIGIRLFWLLVGVAVALRGVARRGSAPGAVSDALQ
jgi:O-antigen ligase